MSKDLKLSYHTDNLREEHARVNSQCKGLVARTCHDVLGEVRDINVCV